MTTQPTAYPGWYPDPGSPSTAVRWFDGRQWTAHVAPAAPWTGAPSGGIVPAGQEFGASPSDPTHWLLPTGRTGWAIAAGYVALFALVLWPLGPIAVALGWRAIVVADRTGRHGRGRALFAIIVGAVSTVLFALLLLGELTF